ncbi:MAG: ABC transporter ATP-binding protein [Synergistaceae bacterium]|jgi:taurine transport system ATP-binding protein|nr:ABC transporter ATP-binding protein [Synergistaceae bacterium]
MSGMRQKNSIDSMESGAEIRPARRVIGIAGLSMRFVTYSGDTVNALDGIDLDIYEGEFVCLLGPSGCGKSTLLRIIAGLEKPTAGTASLDGTPIDGPDWQRGVVFQNPPLYPWLDVEQNVAFGPRMRGVAKNTIAHDTALYLEKVHLSGAARQKIYELSGGMRQRVAIARALINNPRILLMDEPFGALDAITREQMQTLIRSLWADTRKTILFITHDVDEALALGTRVLVMSKGSGKIDGDIKTDFTYRIADGAGESVYLSKEFQQHREKIVAIIMGSPAGMGI